MELHNLTWQEVREWVKKNPVVVIPTGSTEQHGPHLPVKVDIAVADYLARKVCEKIEMLVIPPLPFGYSEIWHRYPGTLSFGQETFRSALRDICTSLIRTGFRKIFILNGHNGNMMLLESVVHELTDRYEEEGIQVCCGTVWFLAKEACDQIGENFKDGRHANEMETSISLFLFPEWVKMEEADRVSKNYKRRHILFRDHGVQVANRWPDPDVFHGVYGNPVLGSPEKGKAYLEVLINRIAQIILDFNRGQFNPCEVDGMPRSF